MSLIDMSNYPVCQAICIATGSKIMYNVVATKSLSEKKEYLKNKIKSKAKKDEIVKLLKIDIDGGVNELVDILVQSFDAEVTDICNPDRSVISNYPLCQAIEEVTKAAIDYSVASKRDPKYLIDKIRSKQNKDQIADRLGMSKDGTVKSFVDSVLHTFADEVDEIMSCQTYDSTSSRVTMSATARSTTMSGATVTLSGTTGAMGATGARRSAPSAPSAPSATSGSTADSAEESVAESVADSAASSGTASDTVENPIAFMADPTVLQKIMAESVEARKVLRAAFDDMADDAIVSTLSAAIKRVGL